MKASIKYRTILADPAWPEHGGGQSKRGADGHYELERIDNIPYDMLLSGCWNPADDAHLYLWVTDNYLPEGIWVMRQVGFRYIRTLPWIKLVDDAFKVLTEKQLKKLQSMSPAEMFESMLKMGLGQYFRGESELLLFGVRGKGLGRQVCTQRKDIGNVIIGPRGEHSSKPLDAYLKIEARSKGPYLEMYCRGCAREGWDAWGKEAVK